MRTTGPRPEWLNDLTPPEAAAAVDRFLGVPQRSGPWVIEPFTVDAHDATVSALRSMDGSGRKVPAGDYIFLRNTEEDPNRNPLTEEDPDYPFGFTMMSNTPDELDDHGQVFDHAEGRILVTGLGLSCVVSGLLAKPEVEHIDVIEYSRDVIRMVGPAYKNEPRVTIHHGDAMAWPIPSDASWDYAWHDIWAKISDGNLHRDHAENGITYEAMFRRYAPHVHLQEAWAFPLALAMQEADSVADEWHAAWDLSWTGWTPDERIDALLKYHDSGPIPAGIENLKLLWQQAGKWDEIVERCQSDDPPRVYMDTRQFLPEAKLRLPFLIEDEYAKYGLVPDENYMALKPGKVAA